MLMLSVERKLLYIALAITDMKAEFLLPSKLTKNMKGYIKIDYKKSCYWAIK